MIGQSTCDNVNEDFTDQTSGDLLCDVCVEIGRERRISELAEMERDIGQVKRNARDAERKGEKRK
jgi:hypothetical protein